MKNWNSFEQEMHDWKPRPPDGRIRTRLFHRQGLYFPPIRHLLKQSARFIPATAVLTLGIFFSGNPLQSPVTGHSYLTEFREPRIFGIQRLQTVIDSSFFQRNSLPTPTLASTNGGRMISSVHSFSLFVTNTLNH